MWAKYQDQWLLSNTPRDSNLPWCEAGQDTHVVPTLGKLAHKINIMYRTFDALCCTGWGAKGQTFHIMALALVYVPAKYCAPMWCRSIHTCLIDKCLSDAMHIVTGCLQPTPKEFLPILWGIQPAELCHTGATISLSQSALNQPKHLFHRLVSESSPGHRRLKSRLRFVPAALDLLKNTMQEDQFSSAQWMTEKWRSEWESMTTPLHLHFPTPKERPAGLDLPRLAWTRLNRLHTRVERFNMSMHKWGLLPSVTCECGTEEQTPYHILCTCPIYQPPHGLCGLVELDELTKKWLLEGCPDI